MRSEATSSYRAHRIAAAFVVIGLVVGAAGPAGAALETPWWKRADFFAIHLCGKARVEVSPTDEKVRAVGYTRTYYNESSQCAGGSPTVLANDQQVGVVLQLYTTSGWISCAAPNYAPDPVTTQTYVLGYGLWGSCGGIGGYYRTVTTHAGNVWGTWRPHDHIPLVTSYLYGYTGTT